MTVRNTIKVSHLGEYVAVVVSGGNVAMEKLLLLLDR